MKKFLMMRERKMGRGEGSKNSTPPLHRPALKNSPGGSFSGNKVKGTPLKPPAKAFED